VFLSFFLACGSTALTLDGDATSGATLFAANCATCHGDAPRAAPGPRWPGSRSTKVT
jgi:mono/diheme cytochrome c family protein